MRNLFLSLFCLFISSGLYAQEPVFKHYTVESGLPGSEVYYVMQDSKGFIWFATDHGVCRFDGTTFKIYTTDDGLADNTIFEIKEDSHQRLWFRSFSGLLSFYQDNKIHKIKNNEYVLKLLKGCIPASIRGGEDDIVWLGSEFGDIYQFKMHPDHSLSLVKKHEVNVLDLPGKPGQKRLVEAFSGKQIPLQSTDYNLKINLGDTSILLDTKKMPGSTDIHVISCMPMQDGTWLLYKHNWLIQFNKKGILNRRNFGKNRIINMYQSPDGDIWISPYKGGVKRFKAGDLFTEKEGQGYFDLKSVTAVLVDKQGGTWFSTIESGVYFMPSEAFYYMPQFDHFEDKKVVFVGGRSGAIFTGLLSGTLYKIKEGQLSIASSSSNVFVSLFQRRNGDIWVSRLWEGTQVLTKDGLLAKPFEGYNAFAEDSDHTLWASLYSSLYKFKGYQVDTLFIDQPLNIRSMAYWNETLWLGTLNGLWSFRDEKLTYHGNENPLFKKRISHLKSDGKGRLWIATLGGGVLIKNRDSLIQITVKDGLLSNLCNTLLIDEDQNIWVGTNNGLSLIHYSDEGKPYDIDNYTINNGLISNEINRIFRQDNQLWVATNNGLSMIDLGQLKPRKIPSSVYITGLTINGKDTALRNQYLLAYDENDIRISFVGISYTSGKNIAYRYRLKKGKETADFKYADKNELQFSSLAPGDYIFYAWAKNAEGVWSAAPASISFTIRPPFWATWWFRMIGAGIIIGAIVLFMRWRFKQTLEKSQLQNELNEVKQQALSSRMNPHFLFNALNSIQNYISLNNAENAHRYLAKFSKLMRLILVNSKDTFISLESELEALKLYIDLEMVRFKDRITYTVHVDPVLEERTYKIPAMVIQPYVENAIKHGLVPKKGKGILNITFKKQRDELVCTISDNGIGREKAMEYNAARKKQLNHESMGMILTDNRIKLLRSIYKREITVEITDLYGQGKIAKGTLVTLNFPIISS